MRHRTGVAAKHQTAGTFCVAFFPEAGSSLIVFCPVTPTCGWKRRSWSWAQSAGTRLRPLAGPAARLPLGPTRAVPPRPGAGMLLALPGPPAGNPRVPGSAPSLPRAPPAGTARLPPVTAATSARSPPPSGGRSLGHTSAAIGWNAPGAGRRAGRAGNAPGRLRREQP